MAFDLKQESDVKEYLDNLGTEYRFGCYSEKNPDGKYFYMLRNFIAANILGNNNKNIFFQCVISWLIFWMLLRKTLIRQQRYTNQIVMTTTLESPV